MRTVQGALILGAIFAIMWLAQWIDDNRPAVRRACALHPSWDYVIIGEDDAGEHVAHCRSGFWGLR